MKFASSQTLENHVIRVCRKQRDDWFYKYVDSKKPGGALYPAVVECGEIQIPAKFRKEFSAAVAGCQDSATSVEHVGLNGCTTTKWNSLLSARFISELGGEAGGHSPITNINNRIGNCAEQHAANSVLNELEVTGKTLSIGTLTFTEAIRPRTMLKVPYCLNCLTLFK